MEEKKSIALKIWERARGPLILLMFMWAIRIFESVTRISMGSYGILPRRFSGLKGILTAPLIHGSYSHLFNNTIPFLVASVVIVFFYKRISGLVIALIWLITGFLVWLFAKPAYHIGASGVVYGMVSFIFWTGLFNRDRKSIVLALIMLFLYSGMFIGILPDQPGISWESHLLGGLTGILVAYLFRIPREEDPEEEEEDTPPAAPFFRSDTFQEKNDYWNY